MPEPGFRSLSVTPVPGCPSEIGVWLWALADVRRSTLEGAAGLATEELDLVTDVSPNTIGTLLYHLAATDMDWLFTDVRQEPFPPEVERLVPYDYTDEEGRLWPIRSEPLDASLARLAATRAILVDEFRAMSVEEFRRARRLERHEGTPEWVIYHLLEHEAHHRSEIRAIRRRVR
ncbi:MAG: DinB family protein [Planctomycetota bacterium]|jgi:hypothetical protein